MASPNTKLKLTPTLLIGLGGTGKDVVLRIRRLFFERFGQTNRYPIIGSLVLDTNNKDLDRIAGEDADNLPPFVRQRISLTQADDPPSFLHCELTDNEFRDYFGSGGRNQSFPHVFRWLPQEMDRYGVTAVKDGAGQNRLFGRLMWFHHYARIRQAITAHVHRVVDFAAKPELLQQWLPDGATVEPGQIEVALVYSLAGGTGCGMFMDTGMLVRDVLRAFPSVKPFITHYMVLPDALTGAQGVQLDKTQKRKVQENAFAALREMEYFALRREGQFDLSIPPAADPAGGDQRPLFEATWNKDGPPVPVTDAPWDTCYLIGAGNDPLRGASLPYHDIYQMIAEHLFLDFDPSEFGEKKRTTRSNLVSQALEVMKIPVRDDKGKQLFTRDVSRRFSTLGLAQLQFDRDRMRRAAAHRLAQLLVERWWLRSHMLTPSDLADRAAEDLGPDLGPARPADDLVTRTGAEREGGAVPRLGVQAVAARLTQTGPGTTDSWIERVKAEYRAKRETIQDDAFDPLAADPLDGWVTEHRDRLTASPAGVPAVGERGIALRTFEENQRRLLADVEARLLNLFRYRTETLGLADTLALLRAYQELNTPRLARADKFRAAGGDAGAWRARVAEARKLWVLARRVTRLELLRGADAAWGQITAQYQAAMADYLVGCYREVEKRVGTHHPEASYQVALAQFVDVLRGPVTRHLQTWFAGLSARESGRRDVADRPDAAPVRTGRVTALLEQQTEAEYDRHLLHALGWDSLDSGSKAGAERWRALERKVFDELARSADRRLQNVGSAADLVLRYFPTDRRDPAPPSNVEAFARELARACEEPLKEQPFARDVTALREYTRDPNPEALLTNLRVYSAPYLRKNQEVNIAADVDIPAIQYLGLAGYNGTDGKAFLDALRRSGGDADALSHGKIDTLDMKDDAIVLYREKAGIPLAYYADLDTLGAMYDTSDRPKQELHLDFDYLNGRLPEIRKVDTRKQTELANCLQLALVGIVIGRVRFERTRGRGDGDHNRDQVTFSVTVRGIPQPLGHHPEEVARRLAEDSYAGTRNELKGQVAKWLADQAGRESGVGVACLWAALKYFREEVRERVERLLDRRAGAGARLPDHPLLRYLEDRVIPDVESRLDGIPGAAEWVRPLREWEAVWTDPDAPDAAQAEARVRWRDYAAAAFTLINHTDLPIPVLKQPNPRLGAAEGAA